MAVLFTILSVGLKPTSLITLPLKVCIIMIENQHSLLLVIILYSTYTSCQLCN